jgi:cell division protein FtsQ
MGKKQEVKQTERERQCKKISKQRANRHRFRLIARRVGLALSIVVLLGAGTVAWSIHRSGKLAQWQQQAVSGMWQVTADAGFSLQNVYLSGHQKVDAKTILSATNVQNGQPILGFSLAEMKTRLEQVPLIRHAQIARVLPNTLRVNVEERQAAAVWQYRGKLQLVDADGVAMGAVRSGEYRKLPLLVGQMEPKHIQEFFAFLDKAPELKKEVQSATLVSARRWNVDLKKGIEIKLPENDLAMAWEKLSELVEQKMLLREDIEVIDLRMPDRMFIKQAKPEVSDKGAQNT